MTLHPLRVFVPHAFFVLLVTCVLVLSSVLIGIIKHIEDNVHIYHVVAFRQSTGLMGLVHRDCKVALILLIVMIVIMVVFIFSYILEMLSVGKREMYLCATLIKQMEATQQAERKSMNKSETLSKATHDIRNDLAGITGLIEISYEEVAPGSELEANLRKMESCAKDLLRISNTVLDTSKIEAGKMQLEEEEFDVAQLLEDAVDLFHPVGLKKGIDVMLDHCDGSLLKFSCARGDRGRLKQILCNLLSNAVKFTSEGHVTVRSWVEKPSFKNSIAASSNRNIGFVKQLLSFFNKKKKAQADMETMNAVQTDPNALEFVFEVDDTGKGIPKERQESVFENYVQVKETALGEGGTGLGLGIVQSLVRLMHGEIGIVDKEIGVRGTCFRFSVLLPICSGVCENVSKDHRTKEEDIEMGFGPSTFDGRTSSNQHLGIATQTPNSSISGPSIHTASPRFNIRTLSANKLEGLAGSSVVLLMKNEERRRISQKFMENLGIKVLVAEQWEQLGPTLEKATRRKGYHSRHHSSSGISELGLQDCLSKSSKSVKEVPLMSAMDGSGTEINDTKNILPLFKRTNLRGGSSGFILLVIDATAGPFPELCKIVTEFKMGQHHQNSTSTNYDWCRVVWLANHGINLNNLIKREDIFDPEDVIKHKALHGSRLYDVVRLLPEFGGALPKREATFQHIRKLSGSSSNDQTPRQKILSPTLTQQYLVSHAGTSSTSRNSLVLVLDDRQRIPVPVQHGGDQTQENAAGNPMSRTPLSGKKVLVAEDIELNRKLAMVNLTRLGASVELCENGRQALDLVRNALQVNQGKHGFDYILMDCEMPEMDGFEATRQIRKEEESYNVHIPIIALTGHAAGEERSRRMEAGMDEYLSKPFQREHLLEIIRCIDNRRNKAFKDKF